MSGAAPDSGSARDPGALVRRDTVLIVAVRIDAPPPEPFAAGPLVRRWQRADGNDVYSTATRRAEYTSQRLAPLLWDATVRWHADERLDPGAAPHGFELTAVELIRLNDSVLGMFRRMGARPEANGVALLHGRLPALPPARMPTALRQCADVDAHHAGGAYRDWAARRLPPGCRLSATEREAVYCAFITARDDLPRLNQGAGHASWSTADQWLWQMYHASDFPPGDEAPDELASLRFRLRNNVRGVLGLRGLVLVGTEPDPGREAPNNYYNGTTYHLTSLYADALALARLHQVVLTAFGTEVARIAEGEPKRREVGQLERDLLVFRRGYWSADFGRQDTVDAVTRTWQRGAGLPETLQSLKDDLGEFSRQVQAAETEMTNAILGLLAAIGLPFGVGLAIWQGLSSSSLTSLGWSLGGIGVVIVLLLVGFPGLRRLLLELWRDRRRS
ncbi:hypothetical protein [Streptomyces buecherae]|uniref:CorA-like Mg2+ transporter protein n=1 Tax=Streptomyces buecherae TaxID=2763006 RepID=A0A7H8N9V7_9ACTN|nr:hypothetical protein [Streptomyces buecherae]QKW51347.1 hypothetical protein HUT08_19415 [Streptomyces buecherae]